MAEIRSRTSPISTQVELSDPKLRAGLYIVATPIGNLRDISERALDTLKNVDVIACEDTRVTAKLLNAFLIKKPMMTYHEHNAAAQRPKLIAIIQEGKAVALVSDAGTPLISDPGYKLVDDVASHGFYITTLPGPSAVIAALTLAGLPTDRFMFLGFSPHKSKARQDWFAREKNSRATLVFFENAKRLKSSLQDAHLILGDRRVTVCREISKKFEEVVRGNISMLIERYESSGPPKGEVVVVLEAGQLAEETQAEIIVNLDDMLEKVLTQLSVSSAATLVANVTGARKKDIYTKALAIENRKKDLSVNKK